MDQNALNVVFSETSLSETCLDRALVVSVNQPPNTFADICLALRDTETHIRAIHIDGMGPYFAQFVQYELAILLAISFAASQVTIYQDNISHVNISYKDKKRPERDNPSPVFYRTQSSG